MQNNPNYPQQNQGNYSPSNPQYPNIPDLSENPYQSLDPQHDISNQNSPYPQPNGQQYAQPNDLNQHSNPQYPQYPPNQLPSNQYPQHPQLNAQYPQPNDISQSSNPQYPQYHPSQPSNPQYPQYQPNQPSNPQYPQYPPSQSSNPQYPQYHPNQPSNPQYPQYPQYQPNQPTNPQYPSSQPTIPQYQPPYQSPNPPYQQPNPQYPQQTPPYQQPGTPYIPPGAQYNNPQEPLVDGPCTFNKTHKHMMVQPFYNCITCNLVNGLGCCEACARVCHAGHQLVKKGNTECYCDCGAGEVRSCVQCKCKKVTASQAQMYNQYYSQQHHETCTYAMTGEQMITQELFTCRTCRFQSGTCICASCAKICHAGHDVRSLGFSQGFCDCGAGGLPGMRCKCMVGVPPRRNGPKDECQLQ